MKILRTKNEKSKGLVEGGDYLSNYCNWRLESLLHLGKIVISFRTLLHLGLLSFALVFSSRRNRDIIFVLRLLRS